MRVGFTAAILCLAVLYTYWAFADLSFLSSTGRLGPGFFPRIVGILLIAACLLTLAGDLKARFGHLAGGVLGPVVRAGRDVREAQLAQGARHDERVLDGPRPVIHPVEEVAVQVDQTRHQWGSGSSPSIGGSSSSCSSAGLDETRYSSPSHFPRSTWRHRVEQNGKHGFAGRSSTSFRQIGQRGTGFTGRT